MFNLPNVMSTYFPTQRREMPGAVGPCASDLKLPRIVLKDYFGHEINTDTSYQRAINESRQRVALGVRESLNPEDWRLPHGLLPARPDYSRRAPSLARNRSQPPRHTNMPTPSHSLPNFMDYMEGPQRQEFQEVGWSMGQLETLHPLTAASLLRQSLDRVPQRTYLRLVQGVPEQRRLLLQLEKTNVYFPNNLSAYCYGGQRAGILCYGCEKHQTPHFHHDKTMRTGGGFTYYRRDRPVGADDRRNPLYWKCQLASPVRTTQLNTEARILAAEGVARSTVTPRIRDQSSPSSPAPNLDTTDVDSGKGATITDSQDYPTGQDSDSIFTDDTSSMYTGKFVSQDRLPTLAEGGKEMSDGSKPKSSLYQAPRQFELKPRERKVTVAKDPFTSDREYNIPKSDGYKIKKSDKKPTQFIDVERETPLWREPTKYELKKSETSDKTEFRREKSFSSEKSKDSTKTRESSSRSSSVTSDMLNDLETEDAFREPRVRSQPSTPKDMRHFASSSESRSSSETPSPIATMITHNLSPSRSPPRALLKSTTGISPPPLTEASSPLMPPQKLTPSHSHKTVIIDLPRPSPSSPRNHSTTSEIPSAVTFTTASTKPEPFPEPSEEESDDQGEEDDIDKTDVMEDQDKNANTSEEAFFDIGDRNQKVALPVLMSPPLEMENTSQPREEPIPPSDPTPPPQTKTTPEPLVIGELAIIEPRLVTPQRKRVKEIEKKKSLPEKDKKRVSKKKEKEKERKPDPESNKTRDGVEVEKEMLPVPEVPLLPEIEKTPVIEETEPSHPPTPPKKIEPPPLPRAAPPLPPPLPQYVQPEKPNHEVSRTINEAPPPMPEPPPQRRPAPTNNTRKVKKEKRRPILRASAPITKKDLKEIQDPLDYLSKYCIIHPDRMPHYERVFTKSLTEQTYRYADVPSADNTGTLPAFGETKTKITHHEKKMIEDLILISRDAKQSTPGIGPGDQMVNKINYTLDHKIDRYEQLQAKLVSVQENRVRLLANLTRKVFPEVAQPGYSPVLNTKKDKVAFMEENEKNMAANKKTPTDLDIVNRLGQKRRQRLNYEPEVKKLNIEIDRLQERLRQVDDRIEDLEDEKKLLQLYSRDNFHEKQTANAKSSMFLRKQSPLYRKLHPNMDRDLNLSEVEEALQQINNHLMTEKEMQYIFHVLDLPGRQRINIQLFSVVAALSEKVSQVEPLVKKMINRFDFEALSVKMEKSKELFLLLDEEEPDIPDGMVTARSLTVELTAGGVTPQNVHYVMNKFNREKKGVVDFLDFLTYIPLFIEIHDRIVANPLSASLSS